jgi:hypothetical protein
LAQIVHPNLRSALPGMHKIVAYYRTHASEPVLVIHNISGCTKLIDLGEEESSFFRILFQTHSTTTLIDARLRLSAYGSIVLGK